MTMRRKLVTGPRLLALLILLALGAAILFALRRPAVEVEIGTVTRGPVAVDVTDLGETRVTNLFVVSAPATGRLTRVPLKPGDPVVAGQTLIGRIEPAAPGPLDARVSAEVRANIRALDAQAGAARARLGELEAALRTAESDFERTATLSARGFATRAALDHARAARDSGRAALAEGRMAVAAAREAVAAARASLLVAGQGGAGRGTVPVIAPVSGAMLRVPQESERVVAAGTPLVEIGDPGRLEIVVDLLSSDAVQVRPGASVSIEDWGGERPLAGRVRRVEPFGFTKVSALGVEEQRVNAVIDFTGTAADRAGLGHGFRVTVAIRVWQGEGRLRVPISALFRSGGRWSLFIVDAEGRARLRAVRIGRMNDEVAELLGGLLEGERVILHPGDRIAEGVRVRPRQ